MADFIPINRRLFLAQVGKGTLALVVLGACGPDVGPTTIGDFSSTTSRAPLTTASPSTSTTTAGSSASTTAVDTESSQPMAEGFTRVTLGFVSAYIVVRGSEAAIIDTGLKRSEDSIEASLGEVGLGWDQVGHVILTHRHPDHAGSVPEVMASASGATGYAGEGDADNITAPRELTALVDGDTVFGLDVIATPGHTPGHICLLDSAAGVLVAGDALNGGSLEGAPLEVLGPDPSSSSNLAKAFSSVRKLAGFSYDQILFGHGEPILKGGSELVAALAQDL